MQKLTGKHYGIILTVLITAALHLAAAFDKILFSHGPDPLFILDWGIWDCWVRISCPTQSSSNGTSWFGEDCSPLLS